MTYQVTNDALTVCFNCADNDCTYFEWEDKTGQESPACPQCGRKDTTLPKFYLEEMPIPALQKWLSDMAERTEYLPLLDYTFKDFKLPGAVICCHFLSEKFVG
jgi:hypothetical protein